MHSTTLCCDPEQNASPFYRAAQASDVEVLKLMIAKGATIEWSPTEVKKEAKAGAAAAGGGGRGNPNVGKTPIMAAMVGGRGANFAAGPGFGRLGPPFREASIVSRSMRSRFCWRRSQPQYQSAGPVDAVAPGRAGAAGGDHSRAGRSRCEAGRHQQGQPDAVAAGRKTEPPPPPGNNNDPNTFKPKQDTREAVISCARTDASRTR
jgi:hypothetical protein